VAARVRAPRVSFKYVAGREAGTGGAGRPKIGLTTNCAQSALLVPVPEAEPVVGAWRDVHDPSARTGVPAHITLVVPWIPPEQVKQEHLEELEAVLAEQPPFDFRLDRVSWFGQRVLWLAPTPDEPFKRLTARLAEHFDTPPWQGEFADVVPHLTVGLAGYALGATLAEAAHDLARKLPIACRAREVDVMCGDGVNWEVLRRVPLAP
jgi:2'-5' RNA ligase